MDIYLNGPVGCSKTSVRFGLIQRTSAVLCTLHAGVDDGKTFGTMALMTGVLGTFWTSKLPVKNQKKKHHYLNKNKVFTVCRRVRFELHRCSLACSSGCAKPWR